MDVTIMRLMFVLLLFFIWGGFWICLEIEWFCLLLQGLARTSVEVAAKPAEGAPKKNCCWQQAQAQTSPKRRKRYHVRCIIRRSRFSIDFANHQTVFYRFHNQRRVEASSCRVTSSGVKGVTTTPCKIGFPSASTWMKVMNPRRKISSPSLTWM